MEEKVFILKCEVEVTATNETEAEQIGLEDINQLSNDGTLVWEVEEKEEPRFIIAISDPNCGGAEIRIYDDEETEYIDVNKTTLLMGTYQAPTKEKAIKNAAEYLDLPENILYVYGELK